MRLHLLGHLAVGGVLLLFAREGCAIEVKELGAIKTDPLRAVAWNRLDLCRQLDIG
jgi:hypothetical protein